MSTVLNVRAPLVSGVRVLRELDAVRDEVKHVVVVVLVVHLHAQGGLLGATWNNGAAADWSHDIKHISE